jgi:hypothetical protein
MRLQPANEAQCTALLRREILQKSKRVGLSKGRRPDLQALVVHPFPQEKNQMARTQLLGSVDLLGLNQYGENPGLSPIVGALIGGGVSGITAMAVGHAGTGKLQQNRELIGLLAGLTVAGSMYAMKSTRHAAIGAAVGSMLASGLAWIEKMVFGTVQMPAATAEAVSQVASQVASKTTGMGMSNIRALAGLGIAQMQQLGIANIQKQPSAYGTIPGVAGLGGVAGLRAHAPGTMPTNLLGAPSAASHHISLMGGPLTHGIASMYGATSIGGGR